MAKKKSHALLEFSTVPTVQLMTCLPNLGDMQGPDNSPPWYVIRCVSHFISHLLCGRISGKHVCGAVLFPQLQGLASKERGSADGVFPKEEIKRGAKAEAAVTYYQAAAEGARSSDGEGAQEEQAGRKEHPRKHLLHGIVWHFLAWKELPEYRSEYPSCPFYPIADN